MARTEVGGAARAVALLVELATIRTELANLAAKLQGKDTMSVRTGADIAMPAQLDGMAVRMFSVRRHAVAHVPQGTTVLLVRPRIGQVERSASRVGIRQAVLDLELAQARFLVVIAATVAQQGTLAILDADRTSE